MKLLIVESPTKARTIQGFVGKSYKVLSSMGHVVDLPPRKFGIDIQNNFSPTYTVLNKKVATELKKSARNAELVILAMDPDREGEAIAYHINSLLKKPTKRALFYEITKKAISEALNNLADIDFAKVEAQQTRRILDRVVGYEVSPLLWKVFKKFGLSAGRVQTVALRLICEREEEIRSFKPKEYWVIKCNLEHFEEDKSVHGNGDSDISGCKIQAKLIDYEIPDTVTAEKIEKDLKKGTFIVKGFRRRDKQKKPLPPYITSTLQQDASAKLNFSTKWTMQIAQQLFEGIELKKEGLTGLITYMRTDSLRIAEHAISSARKYIEKELGQQYLPSKPRIYVKKQGGAHEAIRPTSVEKTPESLKEDLTPQQFKLYSLIWQRFLASQCIEAIYESRTVDIACDCYKLRAESDTLKFDGWTRFYNIIEETKGSPIPELKEGTELKLEKVLKEQKFTQPKPRYTEGTMVRELESKGIGRPSTYAPIISKIIDRRYVNKLKTQLVPTELGESINKILISRFKDIFNVEFTSNLESELDKIEINKSERLKVLQTFYKPFEEDVQNFNKNKDEIRAELTEVTDEKCEQCGKHMVTKWGRYGKFLACEGFPECKNIKSILALIGVKCPECGEELVEKITKKGKVFYGCSNYPKCSFASWDKPMDMKCEKCGYPVMVEKRKKPQCPKCEVTRTKQKK